MKKLGELSINAEKLMSNEELVSLRGGYNGICCLCHDAGSNQYQVITGSTASTCVSDCHALGYGSGIWSPTCY